MTNKLEISRELASVPRELLANFIEYSVPVAGHCSEWLREKEELRALLAAPVVERQDDQQMACMPVERCYDVRTKMIIAFNESRKAGGDLDDGLDAAYKAALRYSPNPLFTAPPAPVAVVPDKYDDVLLPFLALMRNELHANAGKGGPGWLSMTPGECLLEIYYHLGKLQKGVKDGNSMWIKEYSADVANMCMMLADICACLDKVKELNQ